MARADVPSLFIESDMMDKRVVSEAQLKNRIDAFFEGLASRRQTQTKEPLQPSGRSAASQRSTMAYAAGVDVGSTQTKAIVIDEDGGIAGPRARSTPEPMSSSPPSARTSRRWPMRTSKNGKSAT